MKIRWSGHRSRQRRLSSLRCTPAPMLIGKLCEIEASCTRASGLLDLVFNLVRVDRLVAQRANLSVPCPHHIRENVPLGSCPFAMRSRARGRSASSRLVGCIPGAGRLWLLWEAPAHAQEYALDNYSPSLAAWDRASDLDASARRGIAPLSGGVLV